MRAPIILLVLLSLVADSQSQTLDLGQYFDLETVSNPRISPDGSRIVYTRGWIDRVNDSRESDLWIMNADGSRNRFLTHGSSPEWAPDGERVAFIKKGEPGGSQIFVMYEGTSGEPTQITRLEESPSNLAWSPDGSHIAFTMFVPEDAGWSIPMPDRPDGASWTKAPRVVESLVYRRDRRGFLDEGFTHIFVVPAEGGTPRQLTTGDWNQGSGGFSWTPDGSEVLFGSLRVEEAEYQWRQSDVYAVDVQTGATRQLTDRNGPDGNPVVSPDGRRVAYTGYDWTDDTYITAKLYVMDIDGSNSREIAVDLDQSPSGITWSASSRGVYFNVSEWGVRNLYYAGVDGSLRKISDGQHMLSVSDINDNGTAVGTLSSPHRYQELVTLNVEDGAIETLAAVNEDVLGRVQLGEFEEIRYQSVDDFEIQGWIIKPPDFDPDKEYPLILAIHGGPHGMYNVGFNFGWQNHAAQGYVVLYTNPRGSSGYGSAFGNAIKRAYPGKDYDDLMNGVDEVISRGYIDEDNLFVYGCSGGGVLTSWIVGHTDRFAAASANCPVTNWLSFVGTTDGASWYRNFDHLPWDDPSEHLRRSPLMYVGDVTTPTMLMTGVNDLRTPMSQTEEFYQALKYLKVPTAMVRFNDEFHGTSSKPSNYLRTQLYLYKWFGQHARTTVEEAGR